MNWFVKPSATGGEVKTVQKLCFLAVYCTTVLMATPLASTVDCQPLWGGGAHCTVDSTLASHLVSPGLILDVPKIFSEIISLLENY